MHARIISYIGCPRDGITIEVYPSPFFQRVRDLANGCFERHERTERRELNWDTHNGDAKAADLLSSAIRRALVDADDAYAEELKAIGRASRPHGALAFLYALAWDGGGERPLGCVFDWFERAERALKRVTTKTPLSIRKHVPGECASHTRDVLVEG